jgi:hypothetical protein
MKQRRLPRSIFNFAQVAGLVSWMTLTGTAADRSGGQSLESAEETMELRGHVICLAEEMQAEYEAKLPADHDHLYGFKTQENEYYTLLHTQISTALFEDEQVRRKELIVKGRVFPHSRLLEVTTMQSVHDGTVHDLYHYCDICAIKSVAPGPCMCCQAPVELREEPLHPVGKQ